MADPSVAHGEMDFPLRFLCTSITTDTNITDNIAETIRDDDDRCVLFASKIFIPHHDQHMHFSANIVSMTMEQESRSYCPERLDSHARIE